MFTSDLSCEEGARRTIIGQFERIEEPYVIIKTGNAEVKVMHLGLDGYRTRNVMVTGRARNKIFEEELVEPVDENFDFSIYSRLLALNEKFPDIF